MSIIPATPAARRVARELGLDISSVNGTGEYGSVKLSDIPEDFITSKATSVGKKRKISPVAEKVAEYYGINTDNVSFQGKRLKKADILKYLNGNQEGASEVLETSVVAPGVDVVPLIGMRKVIAETMLNSMKEQPQYTMCAELDTTTLFEFLTQAKKGISRFGGRKLTFTDIMVKIVALALKEHPVLNSSLRGNEIYRFNDVHIGVAVALEDGLIVPVVRDAEKLSLGRISRKTKELVDKARTGKLAPCDYKGATFTISNLGNYPVDFTTPIINTPEGGILGISKTARKPMVINEEIVIRTMTGFSLTLDHRIIDGIEGAEFFKTLEEMIQNPWIVLIERTEN